VICNHFCNHCNHRVVTSFGDVRETFSATYRGSRGPVTIVTGKSNSGGRKAFRPGITLPKKENLGGLPSILWLQWLQWLHNTLTGLSRATYPGLFDGESGYILVTMVTPRNARPLSKIAVGYLVLPLWLLTLAPRPGGRRLLPFLAPPRTDLRPAGGGAPYGPASAPLGRFRGVPEPGYRRPRPPSGSGQKTPPRGRPKGVGNKARAAAEPTGQKTSVFWPGRRPAGAGGDRILAG
jgi:hypothetical protein